MYEHSRFLSILAVGTSIYCIIKLTLCLTVKAYRTRVNHSELGKLWMAGVNGHNQMHHQ